jgi:hypothetical protein
VVVQAELLRCVHDARAVGLPRLATAAVRVIESLRMARADEPRFRLAELTDDLHEVLVVSHQLIDAAVIRPRCAGRPGGNTRTPAT